MSTEHKAIAAIATLERLGYTHNGGYFWKPPLGPAPNFDLVDEWRTKACHLQAEVEALCAQVDATLSIVEKFNKISAELLRERAAQRAQVKALKGVVNNFQITGPDDDGLVWLILHGQGTTGKGMFNLGKPQNFAAQVALELEADRKAALAAVPQPNGQ